MQDFRKNCTNAQGFNPAFADNMRKKQKFVPKNGPLDKRNNLSPEGKNEGKEKKNFISGGFLSEAAGNFSAVKAYPVNHRDKKGRPLKSRRPQVAEKVFLSILGVLRTFRYQGQNCGQLRKYRK